MSRGGSQWKWLERGCLLLLPLLYLVAFGTVGFSEHDDGFILGFAWRILNGEVPHRDFLCIRPALSACLHAAVLLLAPERGAILVERGLFYAGMMVSAWFCARSMERRCGLRKLGINATILSVAGFVISVHSFPPMPWHTTDGILLGAASLYLVACHRNWLLLVAAAVLSVGSALCKQSFYPMPLVTAVLALALHGGRRGIIVPATQCGTALLAWLLARHLGAWQPFLEQTGASSDGDALLHIGFTYYFHGWGAPLAVAATGFCFLPRLLPSRFPRGSAPWMGWIPMALAAWGLVDSLLPVLQYGGRLRPETLARSMFLVSAAMILVSWKWNRRSSLLPGAFLALAWCSGISHGYPSPVLYSTPMVFGMAACAGWLGSQAMARRTAWFLLILGGMAGMLGYRFPYDSDPAAKCIHPVGELFPQAAGIRADATTWNRYREMKELAAKYPGPIKVLPAMPLDQYLLGRKPSTPADWIMDMEIAGDPAAFLRKLEGTSVTVLMMTKDLPIHELSPTSGAFNSTVGWRVQRTWSRIQQGEWFDVYAFPGDRAGTRARPPRP